MSNLKAGQRVVYIGHTKNLLATVISVNENKQTAIILFDDKSYIPPKLEVDISSLYIIPAGATYINLSMIDCTCGLKFIRDGGIHSDWCKLK